MDNWRVSGRIYEKTNHSKNILHESNLFSIATKIKNKCYFLFLGLEFYLLLLLLFVICLIIS